MPIQIFAIIMAALSAVLFGLYVIMLYHARELALAKEISHREGRDVGANWVLDMTVDEYVMHQSLRREIKLSQ
jgi:hypothetical protein